MFFCIIEPLEQQLRRDPGISGIQLLDDCRAEVKNLAYMVDLNIIYKIKWSVGRMLQHTYVERVAAGAKGTRRIQKTTDQSS